MIPPISVQGREPGRETLEELIADGWIVDVEAEMRLQEEFNRHQRGVRDAEIFYETLRQDDESKWLPKSVYDEIWRVEGSEWREGSEWGPTDPLQDLLDLEIDDSEVIKIPQGQQGSQGARVLEDTVDNIGDEESDSEDVLSGIEEESPMELLPEYIPLLLIRPPVQNTVHNMLSEPASPE